MAQQTREQFVQQVIESVRERFPLVRIARAAESFSVLINGHVTSLESLYRISKLRPDEFDHQVGRWAVELLRAAEGSPDRDATYADLRERIMPILVGADSHEATGGLLTQRLIEGIDIGYVVDGDRTVAHIPRSQLKAWDIELDTIHEQAIANLIRASQELQAHAAANENGRVTLMLFQALDGYDASRILLPGLHDRLREHIGSPFVAAVPNKDILLCFRNEPETIANLTKQVSRDYRTMPHQVSERLILVTADGLVSLR